MRQFCVHCHHAVQHVEGGSWWCRRPRPEAIDLVTGEERVDLCTLQRARESDDHCGPEGKFFIAKEPF